MNGTMQDEWLRYSCQLTLPGFGKESQQKLQQSKVLIVGAGGLGCPAAQYLAASGAGTIGIADFDTISISNLHRQILYTPAEVGLLKAETACKKLRLQNPGIILLPIIEKITSENVMKVINDYDIVVDGTDNFETKYLLNDACVLSHKPLVYAAIYQYEGQVSLLNVLNNDGTYSPNYRDLFPGVNASQIPSCAEGGVIPTIAGITGCVQANEVIKWVTGNDDLLAGKIFIIDAKSLQSRIIKTGKTSKNVVTDLPQTEIVNNISVENLKKDIDRKIYELIDVRSEEERAIFNIGGRHIPLAEIEKILPSINMTKRIVFYCETGRRSEEATKTAGKIFKENLFYSLKGGLKAWKEKSGTEAT
ncbi:MAG: HesA/MoeB/ThiF family protein [Bacteroidota bacterium]|nr:HesA/MoeB/ThiF family protein [Bacteroidota bacterium]